MRATAGKKKGKGTEAQASTEAPPDGFVEALRAAGVNPTDDAPWEQLEGAAASEEDAGRLLRAYRAQLTEQTPAALRETLSRRAFRFAAECFGETSPEVADLLKQVLEVSPQTEWAFTHLAAALTTAARWAELLDVHDARLAATAEPARRRTLLGEAAHIAKDLAGDPGRAAGYLGELCLLDPADGETAAALERLLERQERWADLVELWRRRLPALPPGPARELRRRIAVTVYEKLAEPKAALAELRLLLPADGKDDQLGALLERLLRDERAPAATRLGALDLLRAELEAGGSGARVTELLPIALRFAEGPALRDLRRESAQRLQAAGDLPGALEQYTALFCLTPDDRELEQRLRQLAESAGNLASLAEALRAAAKACPVNDRRVELLVGAAGVFDRQQGDRAQAVALLEQAMAEEAGAPALRVQALRRMEELYAELGNEPRRLHTLERLATIEPGAGEQRLVWARAAERAAELGETDRALAAWGARLLRDPSDAEALAASARLLAAAERWPDLIELLHRRIASQPSPHQIRADLVEIATLARDRLADSPRAIETWREVSKRFGDDAQTVDALAELYAAAGRFEDLADLLGRTVAHDHRRHADMLARLGDTLRERLAQPERAIDCYARALDIDPGLAQARDGLSALLADGQWAAAAARPLARAAERTDSFALLLELVPHRLAGSPEPARRVRLLEEAAALAERHADDAPRAFHWVCQALPLAPDDQRLLHELLRLAEASGGFAAAAQALGEAIAAGPPPLVLALLTEQRARLLDERLGDRAAARDGYAACLALTPHRLDLRQNLIRTAARVGSWSDAAGALVDPIVAPATRDGTLFPLYQSLATEVEGYPAAAEALAQALSRAQTLEPAVSCDLELRLARLWIDSCADHARAEQALGRALGLDPDHRPSLLLRADLQRRQPDRALCDTLVQLAGQSPNDLDLLREAAELALTRLGDDALADDVLGRLWDQAARLLRRGTPAAGKIDPRSAAEYALERAVERHTADGTPARLRRAIALLDEAAALPFEDDRRRSWLRRAAELTEGALHDSAAAIDLWRRLHERDPRAKDAREALSRLLEGEQRYGEALSLRLGELPDSHEPERRLALRLEIVRLGGLIEQSAGAAQVLRANLDDHPGHGESLRQLTRVLGAQGRPAELADVLEQQAQALEARGEGGPAAAVWGQLAGLAEQPLGQAARASVAWERVAELEPTTTALDALARLKLAAGDATGAAGWLERRLGITDGQARVDVTLQLAEAYLAASQRHRAIACLDRTLGEFPAADKLRAVLVDLYRGAQAWEPLARVLAEGCAYVNDESEWIVRARSAVELYTQVGSLARAVPLLENLVRLQPRDEAFRSALAEGLGQAGRRGEARALLLTLIEEAGWRKSRKRANLHRRLAEVARADGDLAFALEHVEHAASMDLSNREILELLAEVAAASGADERAERAYRSLLVMRRQEGAPAAAPRADDASGGAGVLALTEILLRLHDLARKRDQADQAAELMESALTAGAAEAAEAERLQSALLRRGDHALLDRLFEKRLAQVAGSATAAEVHAQRAACLGAQGRNAEALEARLAAIAAAPERTDLLAGAVDLARAQGQIPAVMDRLIALADGLRRKPDAPVNATLLLQAAQLAEDELGDLDRALALCRRAEEGQVRSLEVWDRLAHIAQKRGDVAECERLVGLIKQSAADADRIEAAAEAYYRAAALELVRPETREAGIRSLCEAVEKGRDVERALELVARVGLPQADLAKILPLYERVARQSGDERMLLDYLERRCATTSVTVAEAREAVDLAVALERAERIEPLLLRLAEVASERSGAEKEATWALLELVQRRKVAGDLEAAAAALEQVSDRLDPERVLSLSNELSERATRSGNLRLAARLLEKLRARTPDQESVWRPLLQAYVDLQDGDGLDRLVSETLPVLLEAHKRNELRLARARFLLGRDPRDAGAVESLRDVILDEPGNSEAAALLAAHFERTGSEGELIDLLEQRFEQAAQVDNRAELRDVALRLGEVLERSDGDRASALYERALRLMPGQRDLLRRMMARTPADQVTADQARLMEDLLGPDAKNEAPQLAKDLAAIWTRLGDEPAVCRVLEKGWEVAPEAGLAGQLEDWYRAHDRWAPLADLLVSEAGRESNAEEAAALLREAADLRRSRLNDAEGSLALLGQARQRVPNDNEVLTELVRARMAGGQAEAALAEVQAVLAEPQLAPNRRLPLLLLRAEIAGARGDRREAVAALQEAYATDPAASFEALNEALSAWREEAAQAADSKGLQDATLALVALLRERGAMSEARELIEPLLHTKAADAQLMRVAGELAEAAGDLEASLTAATKLVRVTTDAAERVTAAERAAALADRLGRPGDATASLEAALAANPGHAGLVNLLVDIHQRTEQPRKLAMLLMDQAAHSQDDDQRFERLCRAGALFVELGEGTSAVMALNDAVTVRANDPRATLLLSDAYLLAGALQDAAALLKPLITAHKGKASPALATLYGQLARIAAKAGDAKAELQALSRAVDADRKNGVLAAQLADRAEATGDDELLVKALRTLSLNPTNGPITVAGALLRQARLAHRQGDTNRAILFAKQAGMVAAKDDPAVAEAKAFITSVGVG